MEIFVGQFSIMPFMPLVPPLTDIPVVHTFNSYLKLTVPQGRKVHPVSQLYLILHN